MPLPIQFGAAFCVYRAMHIKILPLNKFRRLKEFSKYFKITEETVVAYDGIIYSNKELHPDVLVHEKVHLDQQKKHGLATFTQKYLNDKKFRLDMEKEAYLKQLVSIKDEGLKQAVLEDILTGLTSGLYGTLTRDEAEELLGIEKPKLDVNKLI